MSENEKMDLTGTEATASKPAKTEKSKSKKAEKVGFFQRVSRWFREMKSELKKVVWPTSKQTLNNTLIVIACVIIIGAFIWTFDWLAAMVIDALLNFFGKA